MDERDPKKRKVEMLNVSQFLDDIAGEVGGEEEEDEEENEEDQDFLADGFEEGVSSAEAREARALYERELREGRKTGINIIDKLERKYVHGQDEGEADRAFGTDTFFDVDGQQIRKQAKVRKFKDRDKTYLIPTQSDPKLFLVKVKPGKEKEICLTLIQKAFDFQKQQKPYFLLSSFSIDSLSGYIYLEAFKESHVRHSLKGLDDVFHNTPPKLVPIEQMIQVVDFTPKGVSVKKGKWVRIRRGLYKGDLAQIFAVNETRGEAMVKLIPRLSFAQNTSGEKSLMKRRAEKKKFNEKDINERELSYRNDPNLGLKFTIYDGKRFNEGFLYKVVNFKSIETEEVNPTLEEIQLFGDIDDMSNLIKMKQKFSPGDTIRVTTGELSGLVGEILKIHEIDGNVLIKPFHENLTQNIQVKLNEIGKHLKIGDFVKVVGGQFEGETGSVVKVEGNSVYIFSDVKVEEFKVFISDVEKTDPIIVNKSYGGYSLHDMVKIDGQDVGVIVKVANKKFKVLQKSGVVIDVKYQEIRGKRNDQTMNMRDKDGKPIEINSRVSIVGGPNLGREGIVKHVFKNVVFVHSREIVDNSGIVAVHEKDILTQGAASVARQSMSGVKSSSMHGRIFNRERKHEKLYETVRITKGKYKGLIGIVKRVIGQKARVELHSRFKTVPVNLDHIKVIKAKIEGVQRQYDYGGGSSDTQRRGWTRGGITPMHPNTPGRPNTTNIHTSGVDVPITPGKQDVWNPNIPVIAPVTPRTTFDENAYASTPSNEAPDSTIQTVGNVMTPGDIQTRNILTTNKIINTPGMINTPGFTPINTVGRGMTPNIGTPGGINTTLLTTPGDPGSGNVSTPNLFLTQNQPQQNMDNQQNGTDTWVQEKMIVLYNNTKHRVVEVNDGEAELQNVETGNIITTEIENISPSEPRKNDTVMIIRGVRKGDLGKIFGMDGEECIVQLRKKTVPVMIDLVDLTIYEE